MKRVVFWLLVGLATSFAWNITVLYSSNQLSYDFDSLGYFKNVNTIFKNKVIVPYTLDPYGKNSFYIINMSSGNITLLSNLTYPWEGDYAPMVVCSLSSCTILLSHVGGYGHTSSFHEPNGVIVYKFDGDSLVVSQILNKSAYIPITSKVSIQNNGFFVFYYSQNNSTLIQIFREGSYVGKIDVPFEKPIYPYFVDNDTYYIFVLNNSSTDIYYTKGEGFIKLSLFKLSGKPYCYSVGEEVFCAFDNSTTIEIVRLNGTEISLEGLLSFDMPFSSKILFFVKQNSTCDIILKDIGGVPREFVSSDCYTWVSSEIPSLDYIYFEFENNTIVGYAKRKVADYDKTEIIMVSKVLELKPDLKLESKFFNIKLNTNDSVFIPYRIFNLGDVRVTNVTIECVYATNKLLKHVSLLDPKEIEYVDMYFQFTIPGVYNITCCVDPENRIEELNEKNNCEVIRVTVLCRNNSDCLKGQCCVDGLCIKCQQNISRGQMSGNQRKGGYEHKSTQDLLLYIIVIFGIVILLFFVLYYKKYKTKNIMN